MNRALAFTLANALLFQAGWFVCIFSGTLAALFFTLVLFIFHFSISTRRTEDAIAVVIALILGAVHEAILLHAGHIQFVESQVLPPLWLICLWPLLATTFNHSLSWIYSRPLWSSLLGAVFAPLSYVAGVALSSAQWSSPLFVVLPIISCMWLFVLPLHRLLSLRVLSYVQRRTTMSSSSFNPP